MSKFDKDLLPGKSQKRLILNELMNVLLVACAVPYVRVSFQLVTCSLIELRLAVPNKLKYNQKQCKKASPFQQPLSLIPWQI